MGLGLGRDHEDECLASSGGAAHHSSLGALDDYDVALLGELVVLGPVQVRGAGAPRALSPLLEGPDGHVEKTHG